jgi:hypothetical protein
MAMPISMSRPNSSGKIAHSRGKIKHRQSRREDGYEEYRRYQMIAAHVVRKRASNSGVGKVAAQ